MTSDEPEQGGASTVAASQSRTTDPASIIQNSPMSRFQIVVLVNLFALYALDGFDVLSIAFALPGIQDDWGVSVAALGLAVSLGLLGTGAGSLLVAPLSDRWGRRPVILFCLAAMTAGMLATVWCTNVAMLGGARFVAGVGIGGLLPPVSALAAEYSNLKYRSRAVAFGSVGFPIGGFVGGGIAALLLASYEWQSIFVFGGIASAVMLVVTWIIVPESVEFLAVRRPPDALTRVNAVFSRMRLPPVDALPLRKPDAARPSLLDIFRPLLLLTTATVTLTYAFHNATFYYSVNWLPKLAVDAGFSMSNAAGVAGWCSAGGVLGAIIVAWLAGRVEITLLTIATLLGSAISLVLLAHVGENHRFFTATSIILGICLYGGQVSLYALMIRSFPTHARATGAGFVTGFGRLGGILSPAVSGFLFGAGMDNVRVSVVMACGSVIGLAMLIAGRRWLRDWSVGALDMPRDKLEHHGQN